MIEDYKGRVELFIEDAINESGLPPEKVREVTDMMIYYLKSGAVYGETPQGFLKWYTQDKGGEII